MNIELTTKFSHQPKDGIVKDWHTNYEGVLDDINQPIPSYEIKNLNLDIKDQFQKYIQSVPREFDYEFKNQKLDHNRVILRTCEKHQTFQELFDEFIKEAQSSLAYRNVKSEIFNNLPEKYTTIEDIISDYKIKYIFGNRIVYHRIYHDGSFCPCPSIIANIEFELIKNIF